MHLESFLASFFFNRKKNQHGENGATSFATTFYCEWQFVEEKILIQPINECYLFHYKKKPTYVKLYLVLLVYKIAHKSSIHCSDGSDVEYFHQVNEQLGNIVMQDVKGIPHVTNVVGGRVAILLYM